jgi:hypothetical protein
MKLFLASALLALPFLSMTSCVNQEKERKAVPPQSSASKMPWNRPMPGEGGAQFGGMLERR